MKVALPHAVWLLLVLGPAPAFSGQSDERTIAIFTTPLAIVEPLIFSALAHGPSTAFVPLGVNFTAAGTEFSVDAAFVYSPAQPAFFQSPGFRGVWLSAGPIFHVGPRPLRGFFLTPKLLVGAFGAGQGRQPIIDFLVGADFGYQLTYGRLYLAFVIGASVGAGIAENDGFAGPLLTLGSDQTSQAVTPVVGINLQLIRIGITL
jgi:hypothetical protein